MDERVARLAGRQFNRVARTQLRELGLSDKAIDHRVAAGRLEIVQRGVFAIAPVLRHDEWGRFMEATLTAPGSLLGIASAGAAYGIWQRPLDVVTIVRPGTGGPRRTGTVLVYHAPIPDDDRAQLRGIPITSVPRTLLDLAGRVSRPGLARTLREALRLGLTTKEAVVDRAAATPAHRGSRRLIAAVARYANLPVEKARSGAEVRALELIRDNGRLMPRLNHRMASEEADLSWACHRLIVEIDGGPFHLDIGEDARKEACWTAAGWTVRRLPSDQVSTHPERLLALCPRSLTPSSPSRA